VSGRSLTNHENFWSCRVGSGRCFGRVFGRILVVFWPTLDNYIRSAFFEHFNKSEIVKHSKYSFYD